MRRLLGLLLFLWGCLLAVNTTFPLVAEVGGDPVTAVAATGRDCSAPFGAPPWAGIHRHCDATWTHGSQRQQGRLVGAGVEQSLTAPTGADAYVIPGMKGYAFLAPTGAEQVAGIAGPIVALLGLSLLFARRRRHRRRAHGGSHHSHGDSDSDPADYDSDDSGDSGGDSDGGGGGGGGGDGGGGDGGGGD
ncbi:hypothetical protein Cs7R123_24720 [Catellatospora sp. TT07R-123]|uniref:hypothetical protein n=1 Tax=Catellatospora sp. TT07R-123 TaxID=2733863 RepID=UPI001AFD3BB8|nr:hypothetical protein [Catellatospora sp. TT07R-123]GHJ45130.1 hypothetical protein Cs7R123_24720 [Catellatospora sp. TT07R-123]